MKTNGKKLLSLLIVLTMVFGLSVNFVSAEMPEIICTADELILLSNDPSRWGGSFILGSDIDMTQTTDASAGKVLKPIGNSKTKSGSARAPFTGAFDGNGKTISNLKIAVSTGFSGMFGYILGGTVTGVTLTEASVSGTDGSVGTLIGVNDGGTVTDSGVINTTVSGKGSCIGGLIGKNMGTVRNCFVDGENSMVSLPETTSTNYGGFVGVNGYVSSPGLIESSFSTAKVNVVPEKPFAGRIGGFAGAMEDAAGSAIKNCYSLGDVKALKEAGGFIGRMAGGSLENCFSTGNLTCTGENAGGFIGNRLGGDIRNTYYNQSAFSAAVGNGASDGITVKTTDEMQSNAFTAFLNTEADVWARRDNLNSKYPYLVSNEPAAAAPPEQTVQLKMAVADYQSYRFVKMNLFDELTVSDQSEFGLSVLGALDSAGILYEAEPSSYGVYVKSINGKAAGGNDGWMFMVNGISPSSSADSTTIKAGDQVIWFYGTSANNYQGPSWAELNGTEIGAESEYFEGTGISSDPYLIKTAEDLTNVIQHPSAAFRLENDIALKGTKDTPIGTQDTPFAGTFDGNGKTISGLRMETEEYNIGLFGVIDRAKILNVTIKDADITAGGQVGVLCGYAKEGSLIANCHVSGKVTGIGEPIIKATRAGGLVGFNDGNNTIPGTDYSSYIYGVIENCSANVTVNGSTGHVGGLVGFNRGIINLSHADGKVTGENTTGGLVGSNFEQITNSYATGEVNGAYSTGGFVGSSTVYSTITSCYSTGNVIATDKKGGNYFGGFAGASSAVMQDCISTGILSPGWSWNGGFCGTFDGIFGEGYGQSRNCFGNTDTLDGTEIKAIGNDIEMKYPEVALTYTEAAKKIEEMFGVTIAPWPEESNTANTLKTLEIQGYTKKAASGENAYRVTVPYTVEKLKLIASANDANASIEVLWNGDSVRGDGVYSLSSVKTGNNVVKVTVIPQSALFEPVEYTITILKEKKPSGSHTDSSTGTVVNGNNGGSRKAAYINGYEDGTFRPDNAVTRAEVTALLAKISEKFQISQYYANGFSDVPGGCWYEKYVGFAAQNQFISGYEDGTFRPDNQMSRAEFAALIAKYLKLDNTENGSAFSDSKGHWANGYITALSSAGYVRGYEDGTFRPDGTITRAEAVKVINLLSGRVPDKEKIDKNIGNYSLPLKDISPSHWAYYEIIIATLEHRNGDFE